MEAMSKLGLPEIIKYIQLSNDEQWQMESTFNYILGQKYKKMFVSRNVSKKNRVGR